MKYARRWNSLTLHGAIPISPQYDHSDLPQYHLPELQGRRGKHLTRQRKASGLAGQKQKPCTEIVEGDRFVFLLARLLDFKEIISRYTNSHSPNLLPEVVSEVFPIARKQEISLGGQVAFNGLLHAGIEKFRLRRGVEEAVKIAGIPQHMHVSVFGRLPIDHGQKPPGIGLKRYAIITDMLKDGC